METAQPYRFLLINAFSLPETARYRLRAFQGTREDRLMNYTLVAPLLSDVDWDVHTGPPAPHGDWPVETKEEFLLVGAARLPVVRAACESGRWNAVVLLGGGDPGFPEAREIGRRFRIPITSCAHAQMHAATMLGSRFSIIDISETHNVRMADLVVQYRFSERCASVRNINFPLPRPPYDNQRPIEDERARAERGDRSEMVDEAVKAAVAAIEEDGAEVLILGCSAAFWLQPHLEARLAGLGWEVPILEGYRSAIAQAKLLVGLGVDASGLAFPGDHPRRWRAHKRV